MYDVEDDDAVDDAVDVDDGASSTFLPRAGLQLTLHKYFGYTKFRLHQAEVCCCC